MKAFQLNYTFLAIAVSGTVAIKVGTGEQINYDINYAVMWKEGEDPCRNDQLLNPVVYSPCDQSVWIDSVPCWSPLDMIDVPN